MTSTIKSHLNLATRRALLAVTCAAVLAAPMMAQDPSTAPPPQQQGPGRGADRQEHQLEHLTKALNLTPDQVTSIKAIQADSRQQMMAVRQDTSIAGPDKRSKMMSIHQAEEAKVKGVLNDDQKIKYDAMQAKMREHREQHQEGEGSAPPPPPPPA